MVGQLHRYCVFELMFCMGTSVRGPRFFNTNNLWVDLVALKREFRRNDGALPLPVMKRLDANGLGMGMGLPLGDAW